jgi:hypothetical protein
MSRAPIVVRAACALLAAVGGGAWTPARAAAQTFRPDSAAARLNARTPPSDPPRGVDLPDGGVTVPLATPGSRPSIDVTVDGRGPYRFAVETGAAFTSVTPQMAAAAGLVPADTADPAVTVGALGIGAARLRDFRVAVLDAPAPGIDGILGLNAYRDLLLTVDYPAGVVRLERGALEPPNGRDRLALLPGDDLWEFEITVNGRPTRGGARHAGQRCVQRHAEDGRAAYGSRRRRWPPAR